MIMKPEELMIGDYITFSDVQNDDYCPKLKVITLYEGDVYVSVDGDPVADSVSPEDIAGIPLTPKILEKNFGEARNGGYFDGDEFYELFIVEFNDGTWIIKLDNIESSVISRQIVMAGYVHQLQHFLKLVGIEKEIIL